jgi:translation initiation factor 2B subunit (eIF-2B alpha/beta/delta family)
MPAVAPRREDPRTGVQDASTDRQRGAGQIALRAAEALAALPASDLEGAVRSLVSGQPSMAPMWRLATAALEAADHRAAAASFARMLLAERAALSRAAAAALGPFDRVVTHSLSSSVADAVAAASVKAVCARSEPGGEGQEMARVLRGRGVAASEVTDLGALGAAASGLPVVAGADAVGSGGIINKVGTRRLAEAARAGGGSSFIVAGTSKLLAVDLPVRSPFERVPLDAVDRVVTESGALRPDEVVLRAGRFPLHPALASLLDELA